MKYYEYISKKENVNEQLAKEKTLEEIYEVAEGNYPLALVDFFIPEFERINNHFVGHQIFTGSGILYLVKGFKDDDDLKKKLIEVMSINDLIIFKNKDENTAQRLYKSGREVAAGNWEARTMDKLYSDVSGINLKLDHYQKKGWSLQLAMKQLER